MLPSLPEYEMIRPWLIPFPITNTCRRTSSAIAFQHLVSLSIIPTCLR
jgi:hypothetical protein